MRTKKKQSQNSSIRKMLDIGQKSMKYQFLQNNLDFISPWSNNMGLNAKQRQNEGKRFINDEKNDQQESIFSGNDKQHLLSMPSYRKQLINGFISVFGQTNNGRQVKHVQRSYTQPFQYSISAKKPQTLYENSYKKILNNTSPWNTNKKKQSYQFCSKNKIKRPETADNRIAYAETCQSNLKHKYKLYSKQSGRLRKVQQRNCSSDTIFVDRKKEVREAEGKTGKRMTIFNPIFLPASGSNNILHSEAAKDQCSQVYQNSNNMFTKIKQKTLKSKNKQIKCHSECQKMKKVKTNKIFYNSCDKPNRVKSQLTYYNEDLSYQQAVTNLSVLLDKKRKQQDIINRIRKKINYQVDNGQSKINKQNSFQFQGVKIFKGPHLNYSMGMAKRTKKYKTKQDHCSLFL